MNSLVYRGTLVHTRHQPVRHHFRYRMLAFGFNLDQLEWLDQSVGWFGHNRRAFFSLRDRDYLGKQDTPIRAKLDALLAQTDLNKQWNSVFLVTQPRFLGYVFNPVSFYFCFDETDQLGCVVAEVNNTFGEKHAYILDCKQNGRGWRAQIRKDFHVSPFNDMAGEYQFAFGQPQKKLSIEICLFKQGEKFLTAGLYGEPVEMQQTAFRQLSRWCLLPWLTMPRIIWQALFLKFKHHLPINPRPAPHHPMTIQKAAPGLLERLAVGMILRLFQRLQTGNLLLTLPDGGKLQFGDSHSARIAQLDIRDYRFFTQVAWGGHVGFGEAYVEGYWDSPDPLAVLWVLTENTKAIKDGNVALSCWRRRKDRRLHRRRHNSHQQASANIMAHYDLSNDFYRLFLDQNMIYSSALFEHPDRTLEQAQDAKIQGILNTLSLTENDHILEIGCGWGGFAFAAVAAIGCRVTGVTLSRQQYDYVQNRVRQLGLEQQITVLLTDYRHVEGTFDRIVSIEMLEAVGHDYLGEFFHACDRLLKPGGRMFLQVITIPEEIYDRYRQDCDWIQKYVFPGGHLPSLQALQTAIQTFSRLSVECVEDIGKSYAQTLDCWRQRFEENREQIEALGFDRRFIRLWRYYLLYCQTGFEMEILSDLQIVLKAPGHPSGHLPQAK